MGVRPYSPNQQEILKIYEEGAYLNEKDKTKLDEIDKIRRTLKPSSSDIRRYKLWLDQQYISPYTGKAIPLSELFSTKYQIEHIFPQSRFFDDSMTNKVICESEVNDLKGNHTTYGFILKHSGRLVTLNGGSTVRIFTKDEYELHINAYFKTNRNKHKHLLSEEIPESFSPRASIFCASFFSGVYR